MTSVYKQRPFINGCFSQSLSLPVRSTQTGQTQILTLKTLPPVQLAGI